MLVDEDVEVVLDVKETGCDRGGHKPDNKSPCYWRIGKGHVVLMMVPLMLPTHNDKTKGMTQDQCSIGKWVFDISLCWSCDILFCPAKFQSFEAE